jgi:hypothetical protein
MKALTGTALEEALARDRASLVADHRERQDQLTLNRMTGQALSVVLGNWDGSVRAISHAARANPAAAAMIAGGVAWLVLGRRKEDGEREPTYRAITRWEGEGGSVELPRTTAEASDDAEWLRMADAAREKARRRIDSSTGLTIEDEIMDDLAASMEESFCYGLEALSPDARDRIVAQRKQGYLAYRRQRDDGPPAQRIPAPGHPMVAAAVALAAVVVLSKVMRRSRT